MTKKTRLPARAALLSAGGALTLAVLHGNVLAQGADATASPNSPSPYYIGASQAFTYDSNVYRVPFGPSDTYSSTSLLAGFDQPISRQRLRGRANVSANHYFDESRLNNTSYALNAGLDWATIANLSGTVDASLDRHLAAPSASSTAPTTRRNLAQTERLDLVARWGGPSLFTLEGRLGYSQLDYSAPEYITAESRSDTASLGAYYHPRGPLRLGVAARFTHTRTPNALFDPATGTYQSNAVNGKNLDLLADYALTGLMDASARLSYTRQTNSTLGSDTDFSGLTGSLSLAWRPTAKIGVKLDLARDAGVDAARYGTFAVVQNGNTITLAPVTGLYENNRITNTAGLGLTYAATAKISANAGVRYSRAHLVSTLAGPTATTAGPETTDTLRSAYLGANWAIARNWGLACNLAHEYRKVSGAVAYGYKADTVGCSAQYIVHL
ncbi:MAG: hypothetical protein ABI641_08220 [Caldimonas sp.]